MKIIASLILLHSSLFLGGATAFTVSGPHKLKKPHSFSLSSSTIDEGSPWDLMTIAGPQEIVRCEGQSRKTFDFRDKSREVVQLGMDSEGRPVSAEIELWIGPNYTPFKVKAFSENGLQYPIQSLIGTRSKIAQVEVRNVAPMELPFSAACSYASPELADIRRKIPETEKPVTVQGAGAIHSIPLTPGGSRARVFLKTDSRNLNARIELLNGPNNVKQKFDVYTSNGVLNALYVVFETPERTQYTVRIMNQAKLEFPAYAYVAQF
jgi:hypothetical protein